MLKIKAWLRDESKSFIVIWLGSLLLVWLFTRNLRLALIAILVLSVVSISHRFAREILLVSVLTIIPLGMIFVGMPVLLAALVSFGAALVANVFVKMKSLPQYFSASIYVPAIAVSLIIAETL